MSGETEQNVSAWTIDSLNAHYTLLQRALDDRLARDSAALADKLREMDLRYQQRYDASVKALDAALMTAEKAVAAALEAAEKAVAKAELAADKRFDAVNEFRGQLADQAASFMPRTEADIRLQTLTESLAEHSDRNAKDLAEIRSTLTTLASSREGGARQRADTSRAATVTIGALVLIVMIVTVMFTAFRQ